MGVITNLMGKKDEWDDVLDDKDLKGAWKRIWFLHKDSNIIKSMSDKREYKYIEIPINGMRIMLISDPDTEISAASLDDGVGSALDEKELEGTAHFLEHMLF